MDWACLNGVPRNGRRRYDYKQILQHYYQHDYYEGLTDMNVDLYDFELPEHLIAQTPLLDQVPPGSSRWINRAEIYAIKRLRTS